MTKTEKILSLWPANKAKTIATLCGTNISHVVEVLYRHGMIESKVRYITYGQKRKRINEPAHQTIQRAAW